MTYADAHRYRVGTNYQQLPVNAPKCPFANYQRDGAMALGDNGGASLNYEPNSDESLPKQDPSVAEPPLDLGDVAVDRFDHRNGNDEYSQTGDLYRLMSEDAKQRLADSIVGSLGAVPKDIQMKQLCHFFQADADYGMRVARGLGIKVEPLMLSNLEQMPLGV